MQKAKDKKDILMPARHIEQKVK